MDSVKMTIDPITSYILEQDKKKEGVLEFEPFAVGTLALATYLAARFVSEVMSEIGRAYKKYWTNAGVKCKTASQKSTGLRGRRKVYETCMAKERIALEKKKLASMVSARSKCSKTKEPDKCILKMDEMIRKQKATVEKVTANAKKDYVTFGHGSFGD